MEKPLPQPNEVWENLDVDLYRVLAIGHLENSKEPMMICSSESGNGSSRDNPCIMPLEKFMKEFDYSYG